MPLGCAPELTGTLGTEFGNSSESEINYRHTFLWKIFQGSGIWHGAVLRHLPGG